MSINLYFGGHATGDTLTGVENLIGSSYDDVLVGYTGTNVLTGAAGNDALFGAFDDDTLLGGKDNDTLTGGTGADVLNGGDGADTASYLTAAAGLTVSLTTGTGTGDAQGNTFISIENLTGSGFTDTLVGDGNANVLDGGGGSDILQGLLVTTPTWWITWPTLFSKSPTRATTRSTHRRTLCCRRTSRPWSCRAQPICRATATAR